jgi:hypothetical protein
VSAELFAKVQAVLDEWLPKKGSLQLRQHHYLKGSLWCGRCHDRGWWESRLLLTKVKGHGGEYWYFLCSGQDHDCDAPRSGTPRRTPAKLEDVRLCAQEVPTAGGR